MMLVKCFILFLLIENVFIETSWCDNNSTCSYHGVCSDVYNTSSDANGTAVDFTCQCQPGYTGKRCDKGT